MRAPPIAESNEDFLMVARCPTCAVPLTQAEAQGAFCPVCHQPLRQSSLQVGSVLQQARRRTLEIPEKRPRKIWAAGVISILFGGLFILGLLLWGARQPQR